MKCGEQSNNRNWPSAVGLALGAVLVLAPGTSSGVVFGSLSFDVECQPDGTKLVQADIMIDDFVGQVEEIRLVRSTIGECDVEETVDSISVDPLPAGSYSYELIDSEPAIGVPFKYRVTLHDAQGEDLRVDHFFSIYRFFDLESCGPTVIGRGVLRSADGVARPAVMRTGSGAPYLDPCVGACWLGLDIAGPVDPTVESYIDTEVPVLLIGEFWVGDIISGAGLVISEVYPQTCEGSVSEQPASWGALKAKY